MTNKSLSLDKIHIQFQEVLAEYHRIAECERQSNTRLVKDRMRRAVNAGYWVSRPPFGYDVNRKERYLQINDNGRLLQGILKQFAANGSKEQFFNEMSSLLRYRYRKATAEKIARSPVYYGKLVYEDRLYNGKHEPLISKAEHKIIIEKLES